MVTFTGDVLLLFGLVLGRASCMPVSVKHVGNISSLFSFVCFKINILDFKGMIYFDIKKKEWYIHVLNLHSWENEVIYSSN